MYILLSPFFQVFFFSQKLVLHLLKSYYVQARTETSAQKLANLPAVVSGNLICSGKQNQWGEKATFDKILRRNRSEESVEIEAFNSNKIIMTEWKIIFIPSYFFLFETLEILLWSRIAAITVDNCAWSVVA